jgi:hypothetical protein
VFLPDSSTIYGSAPANRGILLLQLSIRTPGRLTMYLNILTTNITRLPTTINS